VTAYAQLLNLVRHFPKLLLVLLPSTAAADAALCASVAAPAPVTHLTCCCCCCCCPCTDCRRGNLPASEAGQRIITQVFDIYANEIASPERPLYFHSDDGSLRRLFAQIKAANPGDSNIKPSIFPWRVSSEMIATCLYSCKGIVEKKR
jgi:hypothetical protein